MSPMQYIVSVGAATLSELRGLSKTDRETLRTWALAEMAAKGIAE